MEFLAVEERPGGEGSQEGAVPYAPGTPVGRSGREGLLAVDESPPPKIRRTVLGRGPRRVQILMSEVLL